MRLPALAPLGLILLLSACGASAGAPPPSTPAKPSAAASAAPAKLIVSYSNLDPTFLPLWLAVDAGVFQRNGLAVEVQNIDSSKGIPALLSGQVQVAKLSGSETLSAAAGGADVVVTSVGAPVYPNVFQVAQDIKTVADLKGKKVGVSSIGSGSDVATRLGLQKVGLDPDKDVSIVAVGSSTNRVAALLSGAIQGGLSTPPDTLTLEAQGFHMLFDMTQLGIQAALINDAFLRSYVAANHDTVQHYVDSLVQATALARKDRAAAVKSLKKYLKSDDDHAMDVTYDYFTTKVIPTLPDARPELYAGSQRVLGAQNDKVKAFDVARMLDDSFVQSAAARGLDKS
jgi:NitT/TauT family transport system substrate-binding protein